MKSLKFSLFALSFIGGILFGSAPLLAGDASDDDLIAKRDGGEHGGHKHGKHGHLGHKHSGHRHGHHVGKGWGDGYGWKGLNFSGGYSYPYYYNNYSYPSYYSTPYYYPNNSSIYYYQ